MARIGGGQVLGDLAARLLASGVAYEQKFDGHRALLFTPAGPGGPVLLQTRRGSLIQDRFPDLVAAAVEQLPTGLVLDGELLVCDPEAGALSFEALLLIEWRGGGPTVWSPDTRGA